MVGLAINSPMQRITPPDFPFEGYHSSSYYHTASSFPSVRDRCQNSNSHSLLPKSSASSASATSIATLTGLRTPPPERRTGPSNKMQAQSYVDGPFLKQFEPPILSNVPKMVDSFLSAQAHHHHQQQQHQQQQQQQLQQLQQYIPRVFDSPPSRRESVVSRCSSADKTLANPGSAKSSSALAEGVPPYKTPESRRSSRTMQLPPLPPLLAKVIRGTIADFAAEMICFFWFESSFLLHRITESNETPSNILQELSRDAIPTAAFRRWVTNILTTTQVSTNVIILALLFVYRLKKLNPSVRGKTGSEYRMITVALMLGNKFLDDNTYTNKTWADVSGINVKEIHIMEVEFLQNMKYNLFTSDKQWNDWQYNMLRFWRYWDLASCMTIEMVSKPQRSPVSAMPPSFPTPPQSQQPSPPATMANSSAPSLSYPLLMPHMLPTPSSIPFTDLPLVSKKRSMDDIDPLMQPPPAKRLSRPTAPSLSIDVPQFPVQLPLPPPLSTGLVQRLPPVPSGPNQHQSSVPLLQSGQLPLPGSSARPLSMVIPGPNMNWNQGHALAPPLTHNITIPTFNTQSRNSSPYLQSLSNTPSPTSAFPSHQQQRLSPTVFLGSRPSPYRPVRGVSSLLIPPTATNPAPVCSADQIQYRPIAKTRTQHKTGVLPYLPNEFVWGLTVPPHPQ